MELGDDRPDFAGCNYIESLSGIETAQKMLTTRQQFSRCNYIESLSGIETNLGAIG